MPVTKTYKFTRTLKPGMEGEDVRKFQKLLNLVNLAYKFSNTFPDGINENGKFTTYFTLVFYHEWLKKWDEKVKHTLDKNDLESLIMDANLGMKYQLGDWGTEWKIS